MRHAYHDQLDRLGDHGARMSRVAGTALRDATDALLNADLTLAEDVISRDVLLDEMRADAEREALELLALQAPVASDLRSVVSAIWIVADLQRMGTLSIHIAKTARRRHPSQVLPDEVRPIFERMGLICGKLADKATAVLLDRDLALADTLERDDDLLDDLQRELFTTLLSPNWEHATQAAVDLALLGRFYERFGDHAVAVARRVIFLVTGENVGGDTTPPTPDDEP